MNDAEQFADTAHAVVHRRGSDHVAVLLHGLGGDSAQPLGLTDDELAGTAVDVVAPDMRAHGATGLVGTPDAFSTESLAHDVLALLDRLGFAQHRLIPVGISMGAAVALRLAEIAAPRLAGAVLIRPAFGPTPWTPNSAAFPVIAELLRRHGPAGADRFRTTAEYADVRDVSPSGAASLVEQFHKPHAVERVVRLETVPGNTAVGWSGARTLGVPVAIVAAPRDPVHPLPIAELWHQRIHGSTLHVVPARDTDPHGYAAGLESLTRDHVTRWSRS